MKTLPRFLPLVAALVTFTTPAFADFNMSWMSIGNAGNLADPADGDRYTEGIQHYGAVDHAYNIGTYEVTNAQYVDFLNAKGAINSGGIYHSGMAGYGITQSGSTGSYSYSVTSGWENRPVVYATWFDAARFCNWMGNGQGDGSMETGAYTLNGATSGIITVNLEAMVYIPSENEWYKAAYYNGTTSTYSLYPNGRNGFAATDANFMNTGLADVGYGAASSYGTYGQGGNAWEMNDAVISDPTSRGLRGGGWHDLDNIPVTMASSFRSCVVPSNGGNSVGFRVASVRSPFVSTGVASGITAATSILQGTVDPNGFTTTAKFEYGLTAAYGSTADVTLAPNDGFGAQAVSAGISGLQSRQIYHYRLTATYVGGISAGADMTFATFNVLAVTAVHGTVSGAGQHDANSTAVLTATPDPGYVLSKWTGDATGKANPLSVVMDSDKTITAVFGPDGRDPDGDGLSNFEEIVVYGTNPNVADTDHDGYLDGYEVQTGHSPLDIADHPPLVAEARTAIEFTFPSAVGTSYRIEASLDLATWDTVESGIAGNGAIVQRFYTTRYMPKRYFRVAEE